MKYELGDRVRIKNHWKRQSQTEQLEKMGIPELEDYLMSDEMAATVNAIVDGVRNAMADSFQMFADALRTGGREE